MSRILNYLLCRRSVVCGISRAVFSMVNRNERVECKFLERVAFLFLSKTIFFNEFSVAEKRVNLTSGMCYSSSSFVKIIFNERFSDLYP